MTTPDAVKPFPAHPRAIASAIRVASSDLDAANDNAGESWWRADAAAYVDDYRPSICVRDRTARVVAEVLHLMMGRPEWVLLGASSSRAWGGMAVRFVDATPACRATTRRMKAVTELLRAAGLDAVRW